MLNENKEERMLKCLEKVKNDGIGAFVEQGGEFAEIIEIYPYSEGMFICNTVKDIRKLLFQERKILFFVEGDGTINILGECEIMGPQNLDTCITKEFIDANCSYEIILDGMKSKLFGKKNKKIMDQNKEDCIALASKAITLLTSK